MERTCWRGAIRGMPVSLPACVPVRLRLLNLDCTASTTFFHSPWLTWGAVQACAVLAERALERRRFATSPRALPRLLRSAAGQACAVTTMLVQLPLAPSLPAYLVRFHAAGAPFFLAAAAWRLRREAVERRGGVKLAMHKLA